MPDSSLISFDDLMEPGGTARAPRADRSASAFEIPWAERDAEPSSSLISFDDIAPEDPPSRAGDPGVDYGRTRIGTAASQFGRGAADVAAGVPKGVAVAREQGARSVIDEFDRIDREGVRDDARRLYPDGAGRAPVADLGDIARYRAAGPEERARLREKHAARDPRESGLYRAGEWISDQVKEALPINPDMAEEFLASKFPHALGSATGFLGLGLAGRAARLPTFVAPAGAGSALQSADLFQDALDKGADIQTAFRAANLGAVIGLSEALPITRLIDRFDKGTGGSARRLIKEALKQGTEEAIQEAGTTLLSNMVAARSRRLRSRARLVRQHGRGRGDRLLGRRLHADRGWADHARRASSRDGRWRADSIRGGPGRPGDRGGPAAPRGRRRPHRAHAEAHRPADAGGRGEPAAERPDRPRQGNHRGRRRRTSARRGCRPRPRRPAGRPRSPRPGLAPALRRPREPEPDRLAEPAHGRAAHARCAAGRCRAGGRSAGSRRRGPPRRRRRSSRRTWSGSHIRRAASPAPSAG